MNDNDTSLIWESFLHEKKKKDIKVRKGNLGQDKPDCISTGERVEKHKKGKGSYSRKKKHSKEIEEARLKEGAFGGPGGSPDYDDIGQGQETSDRITEYDINGPFR